ncbi:LarC family nickel insertion protein [Azorhizobium oxalatiphilum]|nr:LarC family nickel insertion protein [Azorhizobium oxalatiphilum]
MGEGLHIHLDPVGGIAGDMFVAALLAARPDLEPRVRADIAAVLPAEAGTCHITEVVSGGIAARHVALVGPAHTVDHDPHHARHHHHHDHPHSGGAHHHGDHTHGHGHAGHVSFASLKARIADAALCKGTADAALGILTILANAEARMHAVPVEEVHFHEVGDWDSLMDVVAAGSIIAALSPARWSVSSLPLGEGMVRTAHGLLPVPAPATTEILTGFEWRNDGIPGERVTPTGAAILRYLVSDPPAMRPVTARLEAIGYGAGTRQLRGTPNVLRASLSRTSGAAGEHGHLLEIDFDIDDMTGEEIATAADRLRALDGVRDLRLVPAIGKKGRPLTTFALLVEAGAFDAVSDQIFLQTSTLGLRFHAVERRMLARTLGQTADGLPVKHARRPDGSLTAKVESDARVGDTLAARRTAGRLDQ